MGFNVTAPGQKVTVYEVTVGLDGIRNKATGVKSHINEQNVVGLFCQSTCQRPCCFVLQPFIVNYIILYCYVWTETFFCFFCYLHAITLESLSSFQ